MKKREWLRISAEELEDQVAGFMAQGRLQQADALMNLARDRGIDLPMDKVLAKTQTQLPAAVPSKSIATSRKLPRPLPVSPQYEEEDDDEDEEEEVVEDDKPKFFISPKGHFAVRWLDSRFPTVMFIQHIDWLLDHADEAREFLSKHRSKFTRRITEDRNEENSDIRAS